MPTPRTPEFEGGGNESCVAEQVLALVPGHISWDSAIKYAEDLIEGLATEDTTSAYISPALAQAALDISQTPEEFFDEVWAMGVREGMERLRNSGGPAFPLREQTMRPPYDWNKAREESRIRMRRIRIFGVAVGVAAGALSLASIDNGEYKAAGLFGAVGACGFAVANSKDD